MAVLYFDLDGTLLNSSTCSVITTQETFKKFCNLDIAEERIIEKMGIPIEVSFRELSSDLINDENWDEVATFFRNRYKENSDVHTSLYDGIPDFLEAASAQHQHMFIVTSKKSEAAENNLAKLNIRHYFSQVIGSDKVDHYKPHPDPIYKARAYIAGPAMNEIMIGDADTDIFMGTAAGIKTCAVTWGAHDHARLQKSNPDHVVQSVKEMQSLILSLT